MSSKETKNDLNKLRKLYVVLNNNSEQGTLVSKFESKLGENCFSLIFGKGSWDTFSFHDNKWSLVSKHDREELLRLYPNRERSYNEFINLINEIK
tara:strand:+ start:461 stop:745 length:285 start_codon:yes stop_codon:yes gene_type:complete